MPLSLILVGLLLVIAWLSPNHYPPWLASHSELVAATAACFLFGSASFGHRCSNSSSPCLSRPAILIGLLACVPLLQWSFGLIAFFGDAWISSLYLVAVALVVQAAFALQLRSPGQCVDVLATALLVGAVATAFVIFLQRTGQTIGPLQLFVVDVPPNRAPTGNMAQPNQSATLVGLGLAGLAYLYERRKVGVAPAAAIMLVLVAAQTATLSRAQSLLWLAALVLLVLVRRRVALRLRPSMVIGGILLWGLFYFVWTLIPFFGEAQPENNLLAARMQAGPRTVIWQQLISAVFERPIFGWGWSQISNAQYAVALAFPDSRMTESAHNIVIDLLLWVGLPVGFLCVTFAGVWLYRAIGRVSDASGFFCLMVILLLLAHSLVEYPLSYLYYLVPFAMAVGVLEAGHVKLYHLGCKSLASSAYRVVAILAPLIVVGTAADYWRVESAYREMRFAVARIGQAAIAYEPMRITIFDQLEARHRFPSVTPERAMSKESLDWYVRVVQRYPTPLFLHSYAVVQVINDDLFGAEQTLTRLRNLHGERRFLESCRELRRLSEGEFPEAAAVSCVSGSRQEG